MLSILEPLFRAHEYPLGISEGRDMRAGYLRGWGLEFGALYESVLENDKLFLECRRFARERGSVVTDHKLANLYLVTRYALENIPGDVFEFGSYRGGSAVFLGNLLKRLGRATKVYALDTFTGLPTPDPIRDLHSKGDFHDADYSGLIKFIAQQDLAAHVIPVQGLFSDTLPGLLDARKKNEAICLMHIDCDLYEPIKYVVETGRDYMSEGGHMIFDDPLMSSCLGAFEAVEEVLIRGMGLNAEQVYPHLIYRYPQFSECYPRIKGDGSKLVDIGASSSFE